jgi:hypothetical protein
MAFSTGAISLGDVLGPSGYNTGSKDMATLNGRIYYDADGTQRTINCSAGNSFSLGTLRGKYKEIFSGTISDSSGNSIQTYHLWPYAGATINCYYEITYKYIQGRVISATIKFEANGGNIGASGGAYVPQFHAYIKKDNGYEQEVTTTIVIPGVATAYINPTTYTLTNITSSLSIRIASYSTNNSGANVPGNFTWNLTVNSSGQLVK